MFLSYFIITLLVILKMLTLIIITHILIIIINNFLIILNKPSLTGKKIARLTNEKISYVSLILDIVGIIVFLIILLWGIYSVNDKEGLIIGIFGSFFNIDLNLKHLIRDVKYSYITNKGIYFKKKFYKWNKISHYKWISSDTILFETVCCLPYFNAL
ncbi:hypothetical protein CLTEP_26860 [Clostridium tepidiprofundi DSM 19306]|uniref:Uncharacterized protein n=1 Tax=Clostridium tepidiprofundi DSM 19306 TaxID=1121338 RepID=A0A151AR48_9CLOT|nr:hypothetical protein [Clostridium tepidiprofundi]KYH30060.1 hypothetical protein CLTEP_26860 [Clostridium tepidiprofundi DSM 19306]